jgi:hypothetical protein
VRDNQDYEWLGWLVAHPEAWTRDDLATARSIIEDQERAIRDSQPRDEKSRRSYQALIDELEAAIRRHERS